MTFSLRPDKVALDLTLQKLVLEKIAILLILYWSLSYSLISYLCYVTRMSLHYATIIILHYCNYVMLG